MKTLHVVLVCHTELDFDGCWGLYEKAQPAMEQVLREAAKRGVLYSGRRRGSTASGWIVKTLHMANR
jgi:hypothetical protein